MASANGAPVPLSPGGRRLELSEELRRRAHCLCREYLRGAWRSIGPEQMRVSVVRYRPCGVLEGVLIRVTSGGVFTVRIGGLSNLLYKCSLADTVQTQSTEPRQVLLRLYGAILQVICFSGLFSDNMEHPKSVLLKYAASNISLAIVLSA
ncbi:unnamed protein product [Ranitomeya imitator]|uniref:Uncharacterized protein n=1 Tax=Ranitomeya imitator TaxID=111125 RepID=A0ABN9KRS1_9NEOB|nr:unnamed protein product [Ranitomeya imitator]